MTIHDTLGMERRGMLRGAMAALVLSGLPAGFVRGSTTDLTAMLTGMVTDDQAMWREIMRSSLSRLMASMVKEMEDNPLLTPRMVLGRLLGPVSQDYIGLSLTGTEHHTVGYHDMSSYDECQAITSEQEASEIPVCDAALVTTDAAEDTTGNLSATGC